ncbi:MAG TPA: helix-turn-helix domain-containing protein [Clostridiaceae bacterium]|nr:helix-turn-helix domain-containing protein [Clostridiaceae bacterium]
MDIYSCLYSLNGLTQNDSISSAQIAWIDKQSTESLLNLIGKNIGFTIKLRRKNIGFRQIDLAAHANVSASYISDLENGKVWSNISKTIEIMLILKLVPIRVLAIAESLAKQTLVANDYQGKETPVM